MEAGAEKIRERAGGIASHPRLDLALITISVDYFLSPLLRQRQLGICVTLVHTLRGERYLR